MSDRGDALLFLSTFTLDLVHMRSTLAVHHFDKAAGDANNRQGREDEIFWPERFGQVGRPQEMEGGKRRNIHLDAASLAKGRKLGKGRISSRIQIALSKV